MSSMALQDGGGLSCRLTQSSGIALSGHLEVAERTDAVLHRLKYSPIEAMVMYQNANLDCL